MTTIQPLLHHMGAVGWQSNSTASMDESSTSIDEGQTLTSTITTTNCPDGVILYWTIDQHTGAINSSDFSAYSGTVVINNNSGTITINIVADVTTEGEEKFAIKLYTEAEYTNNIANTNVITINDTSRAPVQHNHSSGSVTVPANAYDITFECTGGSGGMGGPASGITPSNANNYARGKGGSARSCHFTTSVTPPFTVNLWPGTGGADNGNNSQTPGTAGGTSGVSGGSSSVGMNGGTGASAGGTGNMGGGGGGAGSLIQINNIYVCIAGGGGGAGGSTTNSIGDDGGNYSSHGGSTPWVAMTTALENGNGQAGGDNHNGNAAGGGGSGGGASYTWTPRGEAGGTNGSSVGQGGSSGVSAYRSDLITLGSTSHNPNIAVFGTSNGWTSLRYKTP